MPRRRLEQRSDERAAGQLALRRARLTRAPDMERLLTVIATATGVTVDELLAEKRGLAPIAKARQVAMYLACTRFELRHSDVGHLLGRDRTTVSHACQLIEGLRDEDPATTRLIDGIESVLNQTGTSSKGEGRHAA
jgi:chromosomal replication initiation ATPase DnaA